MLVGFPIASFPEWVMSNWMRIELGFALGRRTALRRAALLVCFWSAAACNEDESDSASDSDSDSTVRGSCRFSGDQAAAGAALATFSIQGAGSRWGIADLDGDGLDDVMIGANYESTAYIFHAPTPGDHGPLDADATLSGAAGQLGAGLVSPGDATGDGHADLWISAPNDVPGGRVYFLPGPFSGQIDVSEAVYVEGPDDAASLGHSLNVAPDVTGDGRDDVIANTWAPEYFFVLAEPPAMNANVRDAAAAELTIPQVTPGGLGGTGAGDVTGDGVGDLLVGASGVGDAYLLAGPLDGALDVTMVADATYTGTALTEAGAGQNVAAGSDVTGDGTIDVWVGDILGGVEGQGIARMFDGTRRGTIDGSSADANYAGEGPDDYSGLVSDPGDLDGDGVGDVVIGSTYIPPFATHVVYGPITGAHDLADADAVFRDVTPGGISYRVDSETNGEGCREIWVGIGGDDDLVFQIQAEL